jgi:hypothetical protein
MDILQKMRSLNPNAPIKELSDPAFRRYGQVLEGYDFSEAIEYINSLPAPKPGPELYVQVSRELNELPIAQKIRNEIFGGADTDIGYGLGMAEGECELLEYHRCDEFMVATEEPFIMILGDQRDIVNNTYDLSLAEAFFIPVGVALDLYATTLHGYPCQTSEKGYRILLGLIHNTNNPIDFEVDRSHRETKLLTNVNAFLLTRQRGREKEPGYVGLVGEFPALRCK